MADSLAPTYLTIDPTTGDVSAEFSGKVTAKGIDLDETSSDTTPDTSALIRWLDTNGVDVADLFGALIGGIGGTSELQLRALASTDAPTAKAQVIAQLLSDPTTFLALTAQLDTTAAAGSQRQLLAQCSRSIGVANRLASRLLLDEYGRSDFPSVLYRDHSQLDVTTTTETFLFGGGVGPSVHRIPANALGIDRTVKLEAAFTIANSSASTINLTLRVYWQGTLVGSLVRSIAAGLGRTTYRLEVAVTNQDLANQQFGSIVMNRDNLGSTFNDGSFADAAAISNGSFSAAVDTSMDTLLQFSAQWTTAPAGVSCRREKCLVTLT